MYKRLLLATTVVVVTVTVGALSATMTNRLRPRAQTEDWRERDCQHVAQVNAQFNRPGDNAAFLVHAKQMRTHWKTWAMKHQEELRQMLYAPASDMEALRRVYRLLPSYLSANGEGLTEQDVNNPQLQFTWQIVTKFQTGQENFGPSVVEDYAKFHDIRLSASMKPGATSYSLWASGRITEITQEMVENAHGDSSLTPHTREVCPPYEEVAR